MTGARILVVDDDPDMQEVMALALEAGDDRRMPVMDGCILPSRWERASQHP